MQKRKMKKYIHILCAVLTVVFASCSQSEIGDEAPQSKQTILKVAADQGLNTRAEANGVSHYFVEVYTDNAYSKVANVFSNGTTNKATCSDGSFSMILDKNLDYYCLLWADRDATSEVYTTSSLKAVTLVGGKAPVEAWQGTLTIAKGTTTPSALLKRAVAKITLLETGTLKAGTLTMAFKQNTVFDVSAGATKTEADRTESITMSAIDVAVPAGKKINTSDIFVLASTIDAEQPTLTFQITGETEGTSVSNVPLKANFNTNIKGHYSKESGATFTIICDNDWAGDKAGTVTE